jgi:hypothetical protein
MDAGEEGDPDIEANSTVIPLDDADPRRTNAVVLDGDPVRATVLAGITYGQRYHIWPYVRICSVQPRGRI